MVVFAMPAKIEANLDQLLQLGVIELVITTECGLTPVVIFLKVSAAVRICGDLKVTVNSYADMERYLLFYPEEFRAALSNR